MIQTTFTSVWSLLASMKQMGRYHFLKSMSPRQDLLPVRSKHLSTENQLSLDNMCDGIRFVIENEK